MFKTVLQNLFGSHYRCLQSLAKPYALKAAKILHVFCSLKKIYGLVFSCSVYGDWELFLKQDTDWAISPVVK